MPSATGICCPISRSGARGVVGDHVAGVAGLPPRVADRVPGVDDLELGQVLAVGIDGVGERTQQPRPVARCDRAPGLEGFAGSGDRLVGLLGVEQFDGRDDLFGRRVDHLVQHRRHIRSKPRISSQSVTAASKAASSTRAVFV